MEEYRLKENNVDVTVSDFDRVNKLITDNFPGSLKNSAPLGGTIMSFYEINNIPLSVQYKENQTEIFTISNHEEIKDKFESKTKLKLQRSF